MQQNPDVLYVFQDSPRANVSSDSKKCDEVRRVIEELTAGTRVHLHTLFPEKNLGCGPGPMTALNWFFSENECSQVKDRFATTIIDCIVACANSPETSIDEFKVFACDVTNDENNKQIYSDGKRHLSSKNYQRFYDLFIEQKYNNLYNSIIRTTKLSRIKRKLIGK